MAWLHTHTTTAGSLSRAESGTIVRPCVPAGDECTYNYGPKELVGWDLTERRKYLSDKNGFVCRCERCRGEEVAALEAAALALGK